MEEQLTFFKTKMQDRGWPRILIVAVISFAGRDLAAWQKRGHDIHSIVEDPLFVNPDKLDFRLRKESPAFALGFKPFDFSKAGVYGQAEWKNQADKY